MTVSQAKTIYTALFAIFSAVSIGLGTNAYIGIGVFFGLWAIAGIMELTNE